MYEQLPFAVYTKCEGPIKKKINGS